jgi:hypothetical protein
MPCLTMMGLTPKSHFAIAFFSIVGKCWCLVRAPLDSQLMGLNRGQLADDSDWFSWFFVHLQANWVHAVRIVISITVIISTAVFNSHSTFAPYRLGKSYRPFLGAWFRCLQEQAIQAHAIPRDYFFRLYYFWRFHSFETWPFMAGRVVCTFQWIVMS